MHTHSRSVGRAFATEVFPPDEFSRVAAVVGPLAGIDFVGGAAQVWLASADRARI